MRQSNRLFRLGMPLAAATTLLSMSMSVAGTAPVRLEAPPVAAKATTDLPPALAHSGPADAAAAVAHPAGAENVAPARAASTDVVALAHPPAPIDQTPPVAAAHPVVALAIAGTSSSANAAHMEAPASQTQPMAHVASLAPADTPLLFAHSSDAPVSGLAVIPDRSGVKPEAILPADRPHADTAKPAKKSSFKAIRTAYVAAGPRGKANSIRNRIWLKHAPN